MLRLQTRLRYETFAIHLGYNTESLSEQYAGCWLYFKTGQKGCSIIKELRYQSIINTPYYALAGGFEFLSLITESSWNYSDIRAVHKIDLYIPLMSSHLKTAQFNINKILALPSLSQSFLNIADIKIINQEIIGILLTSTAQQNAIKISVISPSMITLDSYQYQVISNPQNISYNTFYTKTVTYLDNLSVEKKRFKHNLLYNYIKGGKNMLRRSNHFEMSEYRHNIKLARTHYTNLANYADIVIDSGGGFQGELTIINTWDVGRIQSSETYKIAVTSFSCLFGLLSTNYPGSLSIYQIEFQRIENGKLYFRIYNLDSSTSLEIKLILKILQPGHYTNITSNGVYNLSITPKEPQFIVGEARYYDMNSASTVFNKLSHIEDCSGLVEEVIINSMQESYLTNLKSIKVSKKYNIINVSSSYNGSGAALSTNKNNYTVLLPTQLQIQLTSGNISTYFPYALAQYMCYTTTVDNIEICPGNNSLNINTAVNPKLVAESRLVYDGEDVYYRYFHIELCSSATSHIADNQIRIIGVNSRKKTSYNPYNDVWVGGVAC